VPARSRRNLHGLLGEDFLTDAIQLGFCVIECVSIKGTLVDLRTVSPGLRDRYHAATRRIARHDSVIVGLF
jgi:hypothetical protein